MPRVRARHVALAAAGGVFLVLLAALVAAGAPGSQAGGRGSTFNSGPDGARAAYLTLRELGYTVDRSHEPLTALSADPAKTVLVLASPQGAVSDQDARALRAFLEAGGIVLATGIGGARALGSASPLDVEGGGPDTARAYTRIVSTPLTRDVPSITMAREAGRPGLDESFSVAYGSALTPAVMEASVGEGYAVWWAGTTPMTNAAISNDGNYELLLNVLGSGERVILWDEHYHGFRRSLWSYAAGTPLPWILAQCAVLGIAALLTWSRRAGPPRPPAPDLRTAPMEFIETVGGLYERARVANAAVDAARRRLRRLLAASAGLTLATPDDQLARLAGPRVGLEPERLAVLLRESDDPAAHPVSPAAALDLVARLQSTSAEIRRSPGRRWAGAGTAAGLTPGPT